MSGIRKKRAFVLEKGLGVGCPQRFFTLGVCRCEAVNEDSRFES